MFVVLATVIGCAYYVQVSSMTQIGARLTSRLQNMTFQGMCVPGLVLHVVLLYVVFVFCVFGRRGVLVRRFFFYVVGCWCVFVRGARNGAQGMMA